MGGKKKRITPYIIGVAIYYIIIASGFPGVLIDLFDLNLNFLGPYGWIVSFILVVLGVLFTCIIYQIQNKDDQMQQNIALPAGSNIIKYLNTKHSTSINSEIYIHAYKMSIFLVASKEKSIIGDTEVDQAIRWTFEGKNVGQAPITEFSMAVTLSAFSSWEDGTVSFSAKLKKGKKEFTINRLEKSAQMDFTDMRYLRFIFPDGVSYKYGEPFILEVSMVWTRGCFFQDSERYFTHPKNYSNHVDKIRIEVNTDIDELFERSFELYSVQKGSVEMVPTVPTQRSYAKKQIWWVIKPDMDSVYVIQITKNT